MIPENESENSECWLAQNVRKERKYFSGNLRFVWYDSIFLRSHLIEDFLQMGLVTVLLCWSKCHFHWPSLRPYSHYTEAFRNMDIYSPCFIEQSKCCQDFFSYFSNSRKFYWSWGFLHHSGRVQGSSFFISFIQINRKDRLWFHQGKPVPFGANGPCSENGLWGIQCSSSSEKSRWESRMCFYQ